MAAAIAFVPYLPWWLLFCSLFIAFVCFWNGIRKRWGTKRKNMDCHRVSAASAEPVEESRRNEDYRTFPMPDGEGTERE